MSQPSRTQLATIGIELVLFGLFTYYGIKWLADVLDPTSKLKAANKTQAENILEKLGLKSTVSLTEYELSIAALLVDPLSLPVSWKDIGGLEPTINEIKESVVLPFKRRKLFSKSSLLSPPKGVLLHGPPGCGKTMMAKATAKQAGCRFINLDVSTLTDKWYGESQKLAAAVFSLAVKIQPCIIFIDEIDTFLRVRTTHDHEATAMMKASFMSLWDGLLSERESEIIIMAATNRPQDIDKAILRRMPCRFYIGLPGAEQRKSILNILMSNDLLSDEVCIEELSHRTEGMSGSDLKELCRLAAFQCLTRQVNGQEIHETDFFDTKEEQEENEEEHLIPINNVDFNNALLRMKQNNDILTAPHFT